jgi:hypothetical protein
MKLATLAPDHSLALVGRKDFMEVLVLLGPPVAAWLLGPKAWDLVTSSLYSLHDSSLMSTMSLTSEDPDPGRLEVLLQILSPDHSYFDWPPVASRRGPGEGGRRKELSSFLQLLAAFAGVNPGSMIIC